MVEISRVISLMLAEASIEESRVKLCGSALGILGRKPGIGAQAHSHIKPQTKRLHVPS